MTRSLPALFIIAAAALCLSFDNYSQLSFTSGNNAPSELYRSTDDDSGAKSKQVADECTHGNTVIDCQSGGNIDCTAKKCDDCG